MCVLIEDHRACINLRTSRCDDSNNNSLIMRDDGLKLSVRRTSLSFNQMRNGIFVCSLQ